MERDEKDISPRHPAELARPAQRHRHIYALLGVFMLFGLGRWAISNPAFLPEAVDQVRAIAGPEAVAQVESLAFQLQDTFQHTRYQVTGTSNDVQWASPQTPPPSGGSIAKRSAGAAILNAAIATSHQSPSTQNHPSAQNHPGPQNQRVSWSPFVFTATGQPVLERAFVTPDPERPYVRAALVRIDLQFVQLHLVAGTTEPRSGAHMIRTGMIPADDRQAGRLLAAFNGGFKAANGMFGMAVNGTTLLPPVDGLATLAFYRDGHIQLGIWGQDIKPSADLIAYRQNCPLLVSEGKLTPEAWTENSALWGKTVKNKVTTWRSGLGISADGRYLIYAVGEGLTVPTLGQALVQGGANQAMQLDINGFWTRFVTYTVGDQDQLEAQKLLSAMIGDTHQFLTPDTRDFFYLTLMKI